MPVPACILHLLLCFSIQLLSPTSHSRHLLGVLRDPPVDAGGCQNYGLFGRPLNTRCRVILRTQKGSIILTTTHMTPHTPRLISHCRMRTLLDGSTALGVALRASCFTLGVQATWKLASYEPWSKTPEKGIIQRLYAKGLLGDLASHGHISQA